MNSTISTDSHLAWLSSHSLRKLIVRAKSHASAVDLPPDNKEVCYKVWTLIELIHVERSRCSQHRRDTCACKQGEGFKIKHHNLKTVTGYTHERGELLSERSCLSVGN